ncbi:MAG: glycosyltransferase family 2 protein [Planctomycetota bacterium]
METLIEQTVARAKAGLSPELAALVGGDVAGLKDRVNSEIEKLRAKGENQVEEWKDQAKESLKEKAGEALGGVLEGDGGKAVEDALKNGADGLLDGVKDSGSCRRQHRGFAEEERRRNPQEGQHGPQERGQGPLGRIEGQLRWRLLQPSAASGPQGGTPGLRAGDTPAHPARIPRPFRCCRAWPSLVAPVYNEVENLPALYQRVLEVFGDELAWELVLVDDGSSDSSTELMRKLSRETARVRGVYFEHNCGQTAAVLGGIRAARGELLATLDADLQNDPGDLPAMLAALADHDAVVGYRATRKDTWVRRISSKIANGVRSRLSGTTSTDTGCSLKLFRTEAIRDIALFEGMHRFLPTLLRYNGYSVIEVPVSHHPRIAGVSKYGVWNRVFKSFRDLIAVRWMRSRIIRLPLAEPLDSRRP